MSLALTIDDLSGFGLDRLESDFRLIERRDGGKTSRTDFALGWMAMAVRHRLWSYFNNEATRRITEEISV